MTDGYLSVAPANRGRGRPVHNDSFFRSLADAHGTRAISVILSGLGSDGAVGMLGRIKECGGITLAQTLDDAEYDEMLANALATGLVDIVCCLWATCRKLIELSANARSIKLPPADDEQSAMAASPMHRGHPPQKARCNRF